MTWLITAAKLNDGVINLVTTGQNYPMLAGNLVALFISMFLCIALSYIYPQDFDWKDLQEMPASEKPGELDQKLVTEIDMEMLNKIRSMTYMTGYILSFVLIIAWPILTLPAGIFSKSYFTFWVVLSLIWGLIASFCCIFIPLIEAAMFFLNKAKEPPVGNDNVEDQDASKLGSPRT